jgi:hypothetical protein
VDAEVHPRVALLRVDNSVAYPPAGRSVEGPEGHPRVRARSIRELDQFTISQPIPTSKVLIFVQNDGTAALQTEMAHSFSYKKHPPYVVYL